MDAVKKPEMAMESDGNNNFGGTFDFGPVQPQDPLGIQVTPSIVGLAFQEGDLLQAFHGRRPLVLKNGAKKNENHG